MRGNDIQLYLSGATTNGGAQTNPFSSLGNFRSSSRVKNYKAFTASGISGVTIQAPGAGPAFKNGASIGNNNGAGNLAFTYGGGGAGRTLTWTPPGGSAGAPVVVNSDTEFNVYGADSSAFLVVDVVTGSLPTADDLTNVVTISDHADVILNLFDDVDSVEAGTGSTKYRAIFVRNEHATEALKIAQVYIKTLTQSTDDHWEFAVEDPAAANRTTGAIQTIADEDTAPTSLTWVTVNTEATAIAIAGAANLAAGEHTGIWFKRIVTASAQAFKGNRPRIAVYGDIEGLEN